MKKTCKSCAAYSVASPNARQGYCRARSPQAIMIGMQQTPSLGLGGFNGQKMATPIVNGYFPPVGEACWCAEWRPSAADMVVDATGDEQAAGEAA